MPSILITAPTAEPVALSDVKKHLRVDFSDDDALILGYISAARQEAEQITRRAFVSQSWRMGLDHFPRPSMNVASSVWYGPQWGISPGPLSVAQPEGKTGYEIFLPYGNLQSVDAVKYVDENGVQQTLAPEKYKVDAISEPARLVPAYGTTWPSARNEINSVIVEFTCGYGTAADVPQPIKQWMLLRIGALYENRESDVIVQRGALESLPFVDGLLIPYRIFGF
jgi:hypothetical protein